MEQLVLKATKRTETGKAAAKRLRETGNLPAVMYNHQGQATMLSVNEAEFTNKSAPFIKSKNPSNKNATNNTPCKGPPKV
jgi:ribosomal protein L25 (general stress protein Ctc)